MDSGHNEHERQATTDQMNLVRRRLPLMLVIHLAFDQVWQLRPEGNFWTQLRDKTDRPPGHQ